MSDLGAAFHALVEDETQELAKEFRSQGASAVDEAYLRVSILERRRNREQGRFVVFCRANGSVGMEWQPDRWAPFWDSLDRRAHHAQA